MRRQLVLVVAATVSLVLVAFLLPMGLLLRTLAADRATSAGVEEAQSLAVVAASLPDFGSLESVVGLINQRSERRTTVFLPDGRAVGAPAGAMSRGLALATSGRAFTQQTPAGREVYVPADTTRGRLVVRTLVPGSLLRRGVTVSVLALMGLGLALLGVAVFVADRLARGTVRPVVRLARAARSLAAGDLTVRVPPSGPPEVRDVCRAVDVLGRRIEDLLIAERETVADLSHRLRTPLTALRLDADGLRDPAEARRVAAGVDALERTVDEIIRAARNAAVDRACDAAAVVAERVAFWGPLAEDQGRRLTLDLAGGARPVALGSSDLAAAVDALLENALSHTPDECPVRVRVYAGPQEGLVGVEVADDGPGLPANAAERGHSGAGSTGLGLDIARRTAEASGGRLVLGTEPSGGARVTLELGPPG